jgi:4-amino-4-deoxy-L-arabinose transferase-like glycosyltransferase
VNQKRVNKTGLIDNPIVKYASLLAVLVLFVTLRWDAWPKTYFADELIPLAVVKHMEQTGTLDTNWENADWRGDYAGGFYDLRQYNFSSYHVALRGMQWLSRPWVSAVEPIVFYRACSLIFQGLAVLLLLDLLRRLTAWPQALIGGLFLTVMPQSVIDAHYARPETFVTLLVTVGMWCGYSSCYAKKWKAVDAVAAMAWGVAFACKISLLPLAVLAWVFVVLRRLPWSCLVAWWCWFVLGFALSAPAALLDLPGFLAGAGILVTQYSPDVMGAGEAVFGSASMLPAYLLAFFGWPCWLVILLSLLSLLHIKKDETAHRVNVKQRVLVLWAITGIGITLFYCLLFAYQKVFFERNLSHLMPLWALLFPLGVGEVWQSLKNTRWMQCVLIVAVMFFLVDRTILSQGIVNVFFGGSNVVSNLVNEAEKKWLDQQQTTSVLRVNPMRDAALLDTANAGTLMQMPRYKLPIQAVIDKRVLDSGWHFIGHLELPFGDLPYNQLQINHAPVAYDYYKKIKDN